MHVNPVTQGKALTSKANNLANRISEFLDTERGGQLTFGARNEPLWRSQIEAAEATGSFLRQGKTLGHIIQVGGSGKTREAILLSYLARQDGVKSLFIVPTQQAVIDFSNRAKILCPELKIGSVYSDTKTLGDLTFITYASALRLTLGRQASEEADMFQEIIEEGQKVISERTQIDPCKYALVHWDENHWYITPSASKLLDQFSHAVNIGYTATPRYYSGKDVSEVFGECIYELEFDVARERKEIANYTNILLRSNITTDLDHVHPTQECSEEVARAINTTERNLIFPDFYKNAEITVKDTKYSLLGEPTLVFGTTISHVHHLADVFNHSLMPHLRTDSSFRLRLQEKGIDPDKVEKIAEPIHSGSNDYYSGMTASEREELIARYEQRKVLCLVSTSLLQQSFDSKQTSVVIDTVPRQTYVGVGQAGMRALRYLPDKQAFIVNTEDADRISICFNDCVENRGKEEGVSVEILKGEKSSQEKAKQVRAEEEFSIPQYITVAGYEFDVLRSVRSSVVDSAFYKTNFESTHRKFTSMGYESIRELMHKITIRPDNDAFVSDFLELVYPWYTLTCERMGRRILSNSNVAIMSSEGISLDTLLQTIDKVKSGLILTWSQFNTRFQTVLQQKLLSLLKRTQNLDFESLQSELTDTEYARDEFESSIFERADSNGTALTTLEKSNQIPVYEDHSNLDKLDNLDLRKDIRTVLKSLSYKEREIIKLLYGLGDDYSYSYEEVGSMFRLNRETIRKIESKAISKLRNPTRSEVLIKFLNAVEDSPNMNEDSLQNNSVKTANVGEEKGNDAIKDLGNINLGSQSEKLRNLISELKEAQSAISEILFGRNKRYSTYLRSTIKITESELAGLTGSSSIRDIEASLKAHAISKIIANKKQLGLVDSDGEKLISAEAKIFRTFFVLRRLNII